MLLFAPLLLILAIVLISIYARPSMRGCLWRMDHSRDREGKHFHHCQACGAILLLAPGDRPDACLAKQG